MSYKIFEQVKDAIQDMYEERYSIDELKKDILDLEIDESFGVLEITISTYDSDDFNFYRLDKIEKCLNNKLLRDFNIVVKELDSIWS